MFLYIAFPETDSVTTPPTVIFHDINTSRFQLRLNFLRAVETGLEPHPVLFWAKDNEVVRLPALRGKADIKLVVFECQVWRELVYEPEQ